MRKLITLTLLLAVIAAASARMQAQSPPVQHSYATKDLPNDFLAINQFSSGLFTGPMTYAQINSLVLVSPGTIITCTNCTTGSDPCTIGSSQVLAIYLNGAWNCSGFGGGGGGTQIKVNNGGTLGTPVNFQNGTSGNVINFSNPSGSNIQATIQSSSVSNSMLVNPSLTLTTASGSGLNGGGTVPLGGSLSFALIPCLNGQTLLSNGTTWNCFTGGTGTVTTSTSLTLNTLPVATGGSVLGNSSVSDNGTIVATTENIQAPVLVSTVAIGTAPLTVTSTTPVANLSIGGNAATATNASELLTATWASPLAIGTGTPAAATFTALTATGTTTLGITGATQCLQVNTSGVVAGTGSACGSGGGGGNVNGPGSSTPADIVLFNNTSGTLLSDAGFGFPLANTHLANSTITLNGTANEITSPGSTALGGTATFAITNPFTFPGKATGAASTTSAATFNIPSGTAPSSPSSGDLWNASGIVKFYDGTHTNSFTTIQAAPVTLDLAEFSGTAGLLLDTGILTANVTTQTSAGAANEVCTYTASNKICVPGSVTNAMLANSTLTITAGTGLSGGGSVALGGSTTINLSTPVSTANGALGINAGSSTGVVQMLGGVTTISTALANGTTATTQSVGNNSTDVATTAFVLQNAFTNPMTTLGDLTYGGPSGAATRLPGPTGPNGITQTICETPAAGAATAEQFCIPGIPTDAQTGTTPYPIPVTDNVHLVYESSASTSPVAWNGFTLANNYTFAFINYGTGLITYTPASGTVNGASTQIIPQYYFGFHYTDNTNTFMPVMPTIAAFPNTSAGQALTFNSTTGAFGTVSTTGTPCTTTASSLQYDNAGVFGCVSTFTFSGSTITGSSSAVLNLSAAPAATGLFIPTAAGAAPTVDGHIADNSTTHAINVASNGSTLVLAVAASGATSTGTTCTNQVLTAISGAAAPTCTSISAAYLPVIGPANGGTGTGSTLSGILLGGNPVTGTTLNITGNTITSNANANNVTYSAGNGNASANAALGAAILAGPIQNGAGGASSAGGYAAVFGGNNSATNTTSQAGSAGLIAGLSTGATSTGHQGLHDLAGAYLKGATVTQWNLQCSQSTAETTQDCGASPTNIIGVAEAVGSVAVSVYDNGDIPINASAAVTAGHSVCAGTTAGEVTDSGGTGACATGITVGHVTHTGGTYNLTDGTTVTASTTLPIVHWEYAAPSAASISSISLPITESGGTSGGVLYINGSTQIASSAQLASGALVVGGGAGGAPTTGNNDFTYTTHTLTGGASAILNLASMAAATGFALPTASGAAPTADGFIAVNSTTHALNIGSNSATLVAAVAASGATSTGTTCTNQVITAISGAAAPTCSTVSNATLANSSITIAGTSVSLGGFTSSLPSPGAIGGTTPAAITGTIVTANTSVTDVGLTTAGLVTTTSGGLLGSEANATIAQGGTGAITQQAALNNLAPSPTRAGDIIYYNGTNWINLAGNNSGTEVLEENASGVPSWAAVAGFGTVQSVTIAGTTNQITATGTCTITTTGTCTLSLPNAVVLGSSGTAGTIAVYPATGNFTSTIGSAATASNTVNLFATVPTNLHLFYCAVSSTTCTLTDSGYAYNAIPYADLSITAANVGTTLNIAQYAEIYSNGTSAAPLGLASPTTNGDWFTGYHITGSAASAPVNEELVTSTTNAVGIVITPTYNATGPTQRFEATGTANSFPGADLTNASVTATQLATQYSKGSCTEVWGGTNTGNALQSGDDAISNNTCYNDSGVTRTITVVKCRSDNASNTTTVNPTFGSAGTGTTILSGALTCGNSYAYSSSGTVSNASWTTGSGIDPAMGGTLTGTSIAVIVEYTF